MRLELISPLPLQCVGLTADSMSFARLAPNELEIPVHPHVGAYGVVRKHDIHKGIDLYCPDRTLVMAIEDGEVLGEHPFTGELAGYPWWNDTDAVLIRGNSGVILYGEISPLPNLGRFVKAGCAIGWVRQVLKKNKGRPQSMLHIELYNVDLACNWDTSWDTLEQKPEGLLDPTDLLTRACL